MWAGRGGGVIKVRYINWSMVYEESHSRTVHYNTPAVIRSIVGAHKAGGFTGVSPGLGSRLI